MSEGTFTTDLAVLSKGNSTLTQVMQAIDNLEKGEQQSRVSIGLSSSVTIELLGVYLRKHGLLAKTRVDIVSGNYDDPVGDIELFRKSGVEYLVLLPFFDNLLPSFEAQLGSMQSGIIAAKEEELRTRCRLVFEKARCMNTVFLCSFHRMQCQMDAGGNDRAAETVTRFNLAVREEAALFANIRILDSEDIISMVGSESAFDMRFYLRNKAPYTPVYLNELARRVAAVSRGFGSYYYKVLALDCDNTLWGGVIGEDQLSGIKLGPHDYPGNIFWRMQHEFVSLERNGVLLCLCSRNNQADIEEVLQKHPDMVLRDSHIIARKVNWEDKPANLRELAEELNVGLDSFVFLDDSPFECEAVRRQLPMVKTIRVPTTLSEYPQVVREIRELFLAGSLPGNGNGGKTEQYRQRAAAESLKAQFDTYEDYLASLKLSVELRCNFLADSDRISELSQKSNQFNVTTRRYGVAEIEQMMKSTDHAVYSLTVGDKFGNAGLTAVIMICCKDGVAHIENFFMSCRVIGRGVEMSVWKHIRADMIAKKCEELRSHFIPSTKNAQVSDFFDRLGLSLATETTEGVRHYGIHVADFITPSTPWIEVTYVK